MVNITKKELASTIGARLKELRTAKTDVGQSEIAEELGLKKQTISGYENGRFIPDITILMAFADKYSCSVDFLLGRDNQMNQGGTGFSEKTSIGALLAALNEVADDEKDYLAESFAEMTRELAILDGHPKRKEFIGCMGELTAILAEYIELTKKAGRRFSDKANDGTLTAEEIATEWARFHDFSRMARAVIDDFARIGLETLISFSISAKKALRIRTGWKPKGKKGDD